jgi:hypothetical protein
LLKTNACLRWVKNRGCRVENYTMLYELRRKNQCVRVYFLLYSGEDNTKMDLREIVFGDVDWIHLAQDRDRWRAIVNTVISLWVP